MFQEIIDDVLFPFGVESSHVEGYHGELLPLSSHIGDLPFNVGSCSIGQHVSSFSCSIVFLSWCILLSFSLATLLLALLLRWLLRFFLGTLHSCSCFKLIDLLGDPLQWFWWFVESLIVFVHLLGISFVGDIIFLPIRPLVNFHRFFLLLSC